MWKSLGRNGAPIATSAVLAAFAWTAMLTLFLVARPVDTGDLWWHLKLGELFANHGPWLESDPLVHTALPDAPSPHEWLFGVSIWLCHQVLGFFGLRWMHAAAVAGILGLVYSILLRAGRAHWIACTGTSAFALLSWYRLIQLRPDLVSIPASFLVYRLLLESESTPTRSRIVMAALVIGVWANCHPLFAIGPALVVAVLLGIVLREALSRWARRQGTVDGDFASADWHRARALLWAIGLGLLAALCNPRGLEQHLTFFAVTAQTGLWGISDEWTPFNPIAWRHYLAGSVSFSMWLATDLLLAAFTACAGTSFVRFVRRPSQEKLDRCDPEVFGLGLAGIVALVFSIRFLWMALLPLMFVARWLARELKDRPALGRRSVWVAAGISIAIAAAFPHVEGFRRPAMDRDGYLELPYTWQGYDWNSVRFLREAKLEGRLFNRYGMGGFLGYWLAPEMQVYLDSRLESPDEVFREYALINAQRGGPEHASFVQILDERKVDFFLGAGLPTGTSPGNRARYTTANLEGVAGWILVYRTADQAVYMRMHPRNRTNLVRVAAYYRDRGVPFDPKTGLSVPEAVRVNPSWCIAEGLLPLHYGALQRQFRDAELPRRLAAAAQLGTAHTLAGDYAAGLEYDKWVADQSEGATNVARRVVYELLRLRRPREALAAAHRLTAVAPDDPRSAAFLEVAKGYADFEARGQRTGDAGGGLDRAINALPVVGEPGERRRIEARYRRPEPL